ncbi:MAG: ECF transporter S component, partial [Candidatus Bathyarchaeales archaeon]
MSSSKLTTKNVTFLAIFIALSVIIIKFIPGIPIVGVPGSEIKFDAAIAPIYGMVIGPYLGFLAALIGGLLTSGSPFTFLTSFAPAVSAMIAGFLTSDKVTEGVKIPGWVAAAVILGALIAGWYLTWVGMQAPLYPILHLAGFFAILITRKWTAKSFNEIGLKKEGWQFKSNLILLGIILMVCAYLFSKRYISEEIWILPYLSLPLY